MSASRQKRALEEEIEGKAKLQWLLQVESCFANLIRTCSQKPKKKKKKNCSRFGRRFPSSEGGGLALALEPAPATCREPPALPAGYLGSRACTVHGPASGWPVQARHHRCARAGLRLEVDGSTASQPFWRWGGWASLEHVQYREHVLQWHRHSSGAGSGRQLTRQFSFVLVLFRFHVVYFRLCVLLWCW